MSLLPALAFLVLHAPDSAARGVATRLAASIREAEPDADACFRVRDVTLAKEDVRVYLTDGYVIFGKPVNGRRISMAFTAVEATEDAEILIRPPNRAERESLASKAGSPTLNEHFRSAVMLFTDGTADEVYRAVAESTNPKPAAEMGLLLAGRWKDAVRNMASSFETRLVHDLLNQVEPGRGFFYTAIAGTRLPSFDVLYDPTLRERILVGAMTSEGEINRFDVWTSFESRLQRQGKAPFKDNIEIQRFDIDGMIEANLRLSATTRITFVPAERVLGALAFQVTQQMDLLGASLDGVPVEVLRQASPRDTAMRGGVNTPFLVTVPAPLEAGRSYQLELRHAGDVIRRAGNDVYFVAARANWYPSRGGAFALFDLTLRAPKELTVVATGELVDEKVEGEWRTTHRRTSARVPFAAFNLGVYVKTSITRGPVRIDIYANRNAEPALQSRAPALIVTPGGPGLGRRAGQVVALPPPLPPDTTVRINQLGADIADSMEWMTTLFGPPLLQELTVSPIPGNFGLGFPGLIYLPTLSFLAPEAHPSYVRTGFQRTFYSEILLAHETAHQWWGNLVLSASYHDDWLQEAMASYAALLVMEKKKGPRALDAALDDARANLLRAGAGSKTIESAGPITHGARLGNAGWGEPWRSIIYDKGSWVLHMLRRRLGDEAFYGLLKDLGTKYRYQQISTEQFQEAAAARLPAGSGDPRLEAFFDTWIYSTGIPKLDLSCRPRGKAPASSLLCRLEQSEVGEDFSAEVPVEVRAPGAKPVTRWIRTSSDPVEFTVPSRAAGTKVTLAPGRAILSR